MKHFQNELGKKIASQIGENCKTGKRKNGREVNMKTSKESKLEDRPHEWSRGGSAAHHLWRKHWLGTVVSVSQHKGGFTRESKLSRVLSRASSEDV